MILRAGMPEPGRFFFGLAAFAGLAATGAGTLAAGAVAETAAAGPCTTIGKRRFPGSRVGRKAGRREGSFGFARRESLVAPPKIFPSSRLPADSGEATGASRLGTRPG